MKKQLLMIAAIAVTLTASAQNKKMLSTTKASDARVKTLPVEPKTSGVAVSTHKNGGVNTQTTTTISQSPNAFGASGNARTILWADPSINAISLVHRNAVAAIGNSGALDADFSIDGGTTWTSNLPVYVGNATSGPDLFNARYPSGAIYNPIGNTVATNAYAIAVGPTLEGWNGGWGGFANGSNQLVVGSTPYSDDMNADTLNGFFQYVPQGLQIIKNTGTSIVLDASMDFRATPAVGYTGNMIFKKGVWSAGYYNYTSALVPIPGDNAEQAIAFSDDGMIGYIASIGHNGAIVDSAYYPIIYKTIDGGTTWTGPINLDMSPLEAAIPAFAGTTGNLVSTSFEIDAVVDAANNLHFTTSAAAGVGGFSVQMGSGASVVVDIYTTDGGTTWAAQPLGVPMTGRGTFGDDATGFTELVADNRPQASRTWDGTKLMFTWFDTDTNNFAGLGNTYPDAYSVGYNTTTGLWTSTTASLKTNSATVQFGDVSYYAFDAAGTQTVPLSFIVIAGSTADGRPEGTTVACDNVYSNDITFVDADYSVAGTPIPLPVITGINDVQTIVASSISLIPNPANGSTKLTYLLNSSSDVTIKVVNLIGATVTSMVQPAQTAGQHEVQLNISDLKAGVYFVNVTAKGSVSTSKLIIK